MKREARELQQLKLRQDPNLGTRGLSRFGRGISRRDFSGDNYNFLTLLKPFSPWLYNNWFGLTPRKGCQRRLIPSCVNVWESAAVKWKACCVFKALKASEIRPLLSFMPYFRHLIRHFGPRYKVATSKQETTYRHGLIYAISITFVSFLGRAFMPSVYTSVWREEKRACPSEFVTARTFSKSVLRINLREKELERCENWIFRGHRRRTTVKTFSPLSEWMNTYIQKIIKAAIGGTSVF